MRKRNKCNLCYH